MALRLRPATLQDFAYCERLYGEDLALYIADPAARAAKLASLRPRWHEREVRLIAQDGADVGWLQTRVEDGALFIVQFFIAGPLRGAGFGSAVLNHLIEEATAGGVDLALEVVKENRALTLYRRFGFEVVGADAVKLHMRRRLG